MPDAQAQERMVNSIDRFAAITAKASEEAAKRARGMLSTLGFLCAILFLSLIAVAWQANAMEQQRNALAAELRNERAARVEAILGAKDVEMDAANFDLDNRVRRDIVDREMLAQEQRSAQLAQLAAQVERDKLVEANCVTPRSIMAGGL